jgi:hypothetical protein
MARESATRPAQNESAAPAAMDNGPAAAALLAAGIGSAALGIIIPLAEAILPLRSALNLWNPVGPLSGKSLFAVVVWLVAWAILHARWKGRDVDFGKAWTFTLVLVAVGFVGSFPLFFELFTAR